MRSRKSRLILLAAALLMSGLLACIGNSEHPEAGVRSDTAKSTTESVATSTATTSTIPAPADAVPRTAEEEGDWTYTRGVDEMTGEHTVMAVLDKYTIKPMKSGKHSSFIIFKTGKKHEVMLDFVPEGGFGLLKIEGDKLLIRFDDDSPAYYRIIRSKNSVSPNGFRIEPAKKLVAKIKQASIMRIQLQFEGETSEIIHYTVKGLTL